MLNKLRDEINKIDEEMIVLFIKRMEVVKNILIHKQENNLPVLDESREALLIKKNIEKLNNKQLEKYYNIFFKGVLESSKLFQGDFYE